MSSTSVTPITPSVYAVLSAAAYADFWHSPNAILPSELPTGWTRVDQYSGGDTSTGVAALFGSGFSASTFINSSTNSVVISFEGTDFGGNPGQLASDGIADIAAGAGLGTSQMVHAAMLYEEVAAAYPGYNITFAGHSLGAGLASVMAVWFGRQATVFDVAPFMATAINTIYASAVYAGLAAIDEDDPSLADFIKQSTLGVDIAGVRSRENLVTAFYTQGEILNQLFGVLGNSGLPLSSVYGTDTPLVIGGASNINPSGGVGNAISTALTLHSVALAALLEMSSAGANSNSLQSDTFNLSALLAQLFNTNLYSIAPTATTADFLVELLGASNGSIQSNGQAASTSAVSMFSADLAKLGNDGGTSSNLLTAVIDATIEDYYWQLNSFTLKENYAGLTVQTFLNQLSGGVYFNTASIVQSGNQSKAVPLLITAVDALIVGNNSSATGIIQNANNWFVQAGSTGMTANGKIGTGDDVMIGAGWGNVLTGGNGNDVLIGGGTGDKLVGGTATNYLQDGFGNDTLGGSGTDTYEIGTIGTATVGTDTIIDKNGTGTIWIGNTQLQGTTSAKATFSAAAANGDTLETWIGSDGTSYQFDTKTNQLTISSGAVASGDKLVINNFSLSQAVSSNGYLGIKLTAPLVIATGGASATIPVNPQAAVTAQGDSQTFTIYGSASDTAAQTVTVTLSGGTGLLRSTGSTTIPVSGSFNLTIPVGQDSVTFDLIDGGDPTQAQSVGLTATLGSGGSGSPATSNTETVTFNAISPPTTPTSVITNTAPPGNTIGYYHGDDVNDIITTGGGQNSIIAANGNDSITGGSGSDTISTWNGDSTIAGGGGQDLISVGYGNNQIYVNSVVPLSTALSQTQTASNTKGSLIDVGDGNNTIVGGTGNDGILLGQGNNTVVCGPGSVTVQGGVETITNSISADWSTSVQPFTGNGNITSVLQWTDVNFGVYPYTNSPAYEGATIVIGTGATATTVPVGIGSDTIYGGKGNSAYYLPNGNNYLDAGGGNDSIQASNGNNTLFGGAGNDTIFGGGGNDYIDTESGNDIVATQGGNSTVFGGTGNDTIYSGDGNAAWATSITTNNSYLEAGSGNDQLYGAGGNDTLMGGSGNASLIAGSGNEYLEGGTGNTSMVGGDGNDTMMGGSGNDVMNAGKGNTTIIGGSGTDNISGGAGNDSISTGDGGTDAAPTMVTAGSGNMTITGGAGVDMIQGGAGTNIITAGDGGNAGQFSQVTAGSGNTTITGGAGIDNLIAGSGSDVIYAGAGGTSANQTSVTGGSGTATLYGGAGVDQLVGGSGSDTIVAGSGTSNIFGGGAPATYQVNSGAGTVTINNSVAGDSLQFGSGITIANVSASATTYTNGVVVTLTLPGGGSVTINPGSLTQATFGDGTTATFAQLLSSEFSIGNTTYASTNTPLPPVTPPFQSDMLRIDTATTRPVGPTLDTTIEARDGAQVRASQLTQSTSVTQTLVLRGTADLIGTGNNVNDILIANAGNDTLIAGTANDTLIGGGGAEDYVVSAATGTVTTINSSTSADTLSFAAGVTLADLSVTTAAASDGSLIATLQNSQGGSVIINSDTSGHILDQISFADGGTASLGALLAPLTTGPTAATSAASVTLAAGIQNMTLTGNASITATGNAQNDVITANSGSDTLVAGSGNDTLNGGGGTTSYVVSAGNTVTIANSGSADTLVFGAGITESDLIISSAVVGGVTQVTIIDNQGGQVVVNGGALNDVSFADGSTATLSQLLTGSYIEGNTLYSNVNVTAGVSTTAIDLTGVANITATANALNDVIAANSGNDTLIAGTGNDTLVGNVGFNTYVIAAGTQTTTIQQSSALDTLSFGAGVSLANLSATATTASNGSAIITLTNNLGGAIVINASAEGPLDQINFANGSTASLNSILAQATTGITAGTSAGNVTLAGGIQNMTLTGTASITATGNGTDDVITANAGNDTLIAGGASDTLVGGGGTTTYEVSAGNNVNINNSGSSDTLVLGAGITEADLSATSAVVNGQTVVTLADSLGGNITIQNGTLGNVDFADGSSVTLAQLEGPSYTVGTTTYSNVSTTAGTGITALTLTGSANIIGTGNDTDNIITSNRGNDTLIAGAGNDTLLGGIGSTTYVPSETGNTTISHAGDADIISFNPDYADSIEVTAALAADGSTTLTIMTSINDVVIDDYVYGMADTIDFGDGTTASLAATLAHSYSGITAETSNVSLTLPENILNLRLGGSANLTATGNDEDDVISANTGNDTLIAGTGNDTMYGGNGNGGVETYVVNAGSGTTTINYSGNTDQLEFGAGITESDLYATKGLPNDSNAIVIHNALSGNVVIANGSVGQISLANGDTLTAADLLAPSYTIGTTTYAQASTTLGAGSTALVMTGIANVSATANGLNDTLQSNSGNDTLISGSGTDTLIGSAGKTTYVVGTGSGVTTISQSGSNDTLQFGTGISLSDLTASMATDGSGNVTITDSAGSSVVILGNGSLNNVTFASGGTTSIGYLLAEATTGSTAMTSAANVTMPGGIRNLTLTGNGNLSAIGNNLDDIINANSGNDVLVAGTANDTLVAGSGNDTMTGGVGATTYLFNPQAGDSASRTLTITNSGSGDTLVLGAGISPQNVTAQTTIVNGTTVQTLTIANEGSVVINGGSLNQISFANGQVLSLSSLMPINSVVGNTQYASVSTTLQTGLTNLVLTGAANINGTANNGNDVLTANGGNDSLIAGAGNDTLNAGNGSDTLVAGAGAATLVGGNQTGLGTGATTYVVGAGDGYTSIQAGPNDTLQFAANVNIANLTVTASNGQWTFTGLNASPITVSGSLGYLQLPNGGIVSFANYLTGNFIAGNSEYSTVSTTMSPGITSLTLNGAGGITATGNSLNDTIIGSSFNTAGIDQSDNDTLIAGSGNDSLLAGGNHNSVVGGSGNDTLSALGTYNTVVAGSGNDSLVSSTTGFFQSSVSSNTLIGSSGNDTLAAYGANDSLIGGTGNTTFELSDAALLNNSGNLTYRPGAITIAQSTGNNALLVDMLTISANSGETDSEAFLNQYTNNINVTGFAEGVVQLPNGSNEVIIGNLNIQIGPSGMVNQIDFADGSSTSIDQLLLMNPKNDLSSAVSVVLPSNVIEATLTGANNLSATGNALDDIISANSGSDTLTAGTGADTLIAGSGNDTLVAGSGSDVFEVGTGTATIMNSTYADVVAFGDSFLSEITAKSVTTNNVTVVTLTSSEEAGTIVVDGGNAVVATQNGNVTVAQLLGIAPTTVNSSVNVTLAGGVTNLTLTGNANLTATGNNLADVITGNSGNDTLIAGNSLQTVADIPNDVYGGEFQFPTNETVVGHNTLIGGTGNDTFVLNSNTDVIVEAANTGNNTEQASFSTTLAANVQNLTGTGFSRIALTGNNLANVITANNGQDTLAAGSGLATLIGGSGTTFVVDNSGDVIHTTGQGNIEESSASITAAANVQTLVGESSSLDEGNGDWTSYVNVGGSVTLTGNTLNDSIYGSGNDDTLVAGSGNDTIYSPGSGTLTTYNYNNRGAGDVMVGGNGGSTVYSINAAIGSYALNDTSIEFGGYVATIVNSQSSDELVLNNATAGILATSVQVNGTTDVYLSVENSGTAVEIVGGNLSEVNVVGVGTTTIAQLLAQTATAYSATSVVLAAGANVMTLTGNASITATGNSGADAITANNGNDTLIGGAGNYSSDTLIGGSGNDTFVLGGYNQDYIVEAANNGNNTEQTAYDATLAANVQNLTGTGGNSIVLVGNSQTCTITANNGYDTLVAGSSNTTLIGGSGGGFMYGNNGVGPTTYIVNSGDGNITVNDSGSTDVLEFGAGITASNIIASSTGSGNATVVTLTILGGNTVVLDAPAFSQVTFAGGTSTTLAALLAQVNTSISSSSSIVMPAGVTQLTLTGTSSISGTGNNLADTIIANSGNDTLIAGSGLATLVGGSGNDTFEINNTGDVISKATNTGSNTEQTSVSTTLAANVQNLTGTGASSLTLTGNNLANVITANTGADTLVAGSGLATLIGGTGNDTFVIDNASDVITKATNTGSNVEQTSISTTLAANVQKLVGTGSNALTLTGNTIANTITANSGNDTLVAGSGVSTLIGGTGNDTFTINSTSDVITEAANTGNNTEQTSVSVTLAANVQNLTGTGTGALTLTGNTLNDVITANSTGADKLIAGSGNDTLVSGTAVDSLTGGAGNDTFVVNNASDVVTKAANTGSNTEQTSVSLTIAANVQNLTGTGTSALTLTGSTTAATITANNAADTLVAGTGIATLIGGAGNDTFVINNVSDVISKAANTGNNTEQSSVSTTLAANVQNLTGTSTGNLTLTGNALANIITANTGADTLIAGSGVATLVGGTGNDTFVINNASDVVTKAANTGSNTEQTSVSASIAANVQNLTGTSTGSLMLTGGTTADTITANSGADTLVAGSGVATLIGGSGNDTFVINSASDVITKAANTGSNTEQTSVSATVVANVQNLTGTGTNALTLTGSTTAVTITANNAADTLVAGTGIATLVGGTGNDTFTINSASDVITEAANTGNNTEQTSVSTTLAANVQNLTGTGTGVLTLTGNTGNDVITSNTGVDTLVAGAGNDTFVVNNASDVITASTAKAGNVVQSTVSYVLPANLLNLTGTGSNNISLTGNTLADTITANTGADTLVSGSGVDTLVGGTGNDTFVVNNSSDAITVTTAKAGNVTQSSVNYVLPANLLSLTGTTSAAISLTGNTLADTITANTGADTLISGTGIDTLVGGTGNDTFVVNNSSDAITVTTAKAGNVTQSNVNYVLPTNLLNLTGVGTNNISLTGNASADKITANSGNDTLIAGSGLATLVGGTGNDTFVINSASDVITEAANTGNNTEQTSVTATLAANVQNLTGTGSGTLTLTGNTLNDVITAGTGADKLVAGAGNDTLTAGSGNDTLTGGAGNDVFNVNNTADVVTATAGTNVNTINTSVSYTASTNVQDLFVTGTGTVTATGNSGNDLIIGSSGANTLVGGSGISVLEAGSGATTLKDTAAANALIGGAGNDTMTGGTGASFIAGGAGNDAITLGAGTAVVAFNTGDGAATIAAGTGLSNVLSLGGGISYANLTFSKSGNNLILSTGGKNAITFTNWYSGTADQNFVTLQVIEQSASTYSASSTNVLYNEEVEDFSFTQLVSAFNAALAATPTLTSWSLTNALLTDHLSGSNTAALGGDLAYYDGLNGNLTGMNLATAVTTLSSSTYGKTAQTIDAWSGISTSNNKLH